VSKVNTSSTFPKEGIFTQDAEEIARHMSSKKVSPKGIGSGIRMIQYFINRAGRNLNSSRKKELRRAIMIMQKKAKSQKKSHRRRNQAR
jgi:tRNA(adenine34) deaminase